MRKTTIKDHLSSSELEERMKTSESRNQFQRWQVIYLLATQDKKAAEVAKISGVSQSTVYQWIYQYNHNGPSSLILKGRGGRRNALLSLEEEEQLLEEIASDASKGLVITAKILRQKAEEKIGRPVSKDYAYDLLHRHGWRKVSPRPHHPKQNEEIQEEFKKNFQN